MNSRFSIAVHILTLLSSTPEERLTSEFIAGSVGTNPVVIRRQLALLRKAGLVDSRGARGGGWVLTRPPQKIKLDEVRLALGSEGEFRMHRNEPDPRCAVGQNVRQALGLVYDDVDATVNRRLRAWTVQDMLMEVQHIIQSKPQR
jgi:DNA-binding IscR family transcriptional regulator